MALNIPKETTSRFFEVRDPEKAIGLWSCHVDFSTTLKPISPTRETLGKFFNADLARFETHAEALKMMAAKGWEKSASRKLKEYEAQYLGKTYDENGKGEWTPVPRWFRAWHNFGKWLECVRTAKPYEDVRLSFGYPITGLNCTAGKHRSGRLIFLRRNGRNYLAVMMKEGWWGWDVIEKSAYKPDYYERLILSSSHGVIWQTVDAFIIEELLARKELCLFEMEKNDVFDALTGEKNASELLGKVSRNFEIFVHDPNGSGERFYLNWSATFNPRKSRYTACDRTVARLVEVMRERKKEWIERQITVATPEGAVKAARWVAENNGCIVLPPDYTDELRYEVVRALSYVTFPDREIDAPGGILKGYQLPGRMVQYATKTIRYDGRQDMIDMAAERTRKATEKKRTLIVDTLLDRAARVVAERNGLEKDDAKSRIEAVGGREIIETAAWRWGFMEGNALQLFTATPQAGSLKLPDLSLALGFEHRLGLDGGKASVGKLVQTAKILPLDDAIDSQRYCKDAMIAARRIFTPKAGKENDNVLYLSDSVRIISDDGRYMLLAFPKFAQYQYERDLAFDEAGGGKSVCVKAYRSVSKGGDRSRHDNRIEVEKLDFNKIVNLARDGRAYLYSLDVGPARWLFEATYSELNKSPCWFVPTIPQILPLGTQADAPRPQKKGGSYMESAVKEKANEVAVRILFTANPQVKYDGRKHEGRSWKSYCDAYPEEAGRRQILWPVGAPTQETLKDAVRQVVATDGVLMTDVEHLPEALDAMGYVVTQNSDPYAPGGVYRGYVLVDRVFKTTDGREEWRIASGKARGISEDSEQRKRTEDRRKEKAGKPLVEVMAADAIGEVEREFSVMIEAEELSDKKTAKFFTLEAPIAIGDEYKEMVAREFRRIAYTGTMAWRRQLIRPAHEVALGIWLARLQPDPDLKARAQTRNTAPQCPPKPKRASGPTPAQAARLAQLDALLAEELVTKDEYEAKRREILDS